MDSRIFGVLIFVAVMLIKTGLCIDCHQCASWDDSTCGDPYGEDNMDGCDDRDTHCLKIKIVNKLYDSGFISGVPRESVVASRGCIRADGEGDWCHGSEVAGGIMIRCICSTDGCNSGRGLNPSIVITLLAAMLVLLLRRWH